MKDESWIQSDGQIINRAQKNPHDQGTLWAIELPDGDVFGAVLAKADAASVSNYCEMVRNEWNERKEESEAKARRKAASAERSAGGTPPANGAPPVPAPEASTSFVEGLGEQLSRAQDRQEQLTAELVRVNQEVTALKAALTTLEFSPHVKEGSGLKTISRESDE